MLGFFFCSFLFAQLSNTRLFCYFLQTPVICCNCPSSVILAVPSGSSLQSVENLHKVYQILAYFFHNLGTPFQKLECTFSFWRFRISFSIAFEFIHIFPSVMRERLLPLSFFFENEKRIEIMPENNRAFDLQSRQFSSARIF